MEKCGKHVCLASTLDENSSRDASLCKGMMNFRFLKPLVLKTFVLKTFILVVFFGLQMVTGWMVVSVVGNQLKSQSL